MPPSMSSSEALVIWMLRIAMNAPIMPARTAIQAVVLALSEEGAAIPTGPGEPREAVCVVVDIAPSCHALAGEPYRPQFMRSDAEAIWVVEVFVSMVG